MALEGYLSDRVLATATWQYLERAIGRLFRHEGFSGVRMVGQTGDKGADVLAHKGEKRWLAQVKYRQSGKVDIDAIDETVKASRFYRAQIPVVATNHIFTARAINQQKTVMASGVPLQLWDRSELRERWKRLPAYPPGMLKAYPYQEYPISGIVDL
ncbi:MAG: restriction endonuclease, partial [Dehalococcoidales bacterium]|nr:restriction endonuclease [Dehalococcoidales bacterium]